LGWSDPMVPPARSKALLGPVGRFREPARSNADAGSDSVEDWTSAAGVAFGALGGGAFCVTLVVGGDGRFVVAAGVWADCAGVVDACCCFEGID
jgi:hypothetical protein